MSGPVLWLSPFLALLPDAAVWIAALGVGLFVAFRGRPLAGALLLLGAVVQLFGVALDLLVWIGQVAEVVPFALGGWTRHLDAVLVFVGWALVVPAVFLQRAAMPVPPE